MTWPMPRCSDELSAVGRDDARALLTAVLERVQPEVGELGRLRVAVDAEDAAHRGTSRPHVPRLDAPGQRREAAGGPSARERLVMERVAWFWRPDPRLSSGSSMGALDELLASWRSNPDADSTVALCAYLGAAGQEELVREVAQHRADLARGRRDRDARGRSDVPRRRLAPRSAVGARPRR